MYNAVLNQVFSDQNCLMLSTFCTCVTDSSPVTADKKWASVHLVKVHKLRNAQSTHPVVNHAQDLYQLVIGTIDVSCT